MLHNVTLVNSNVLPKLSLAERHQRWTQTILHFPPANFLSSATTKSLRNLLSIEHTETQLYMYLQEILQIYRTYQITSVREQNRYVFKDNNT